MKHLKNKALLLILTVYLLIKIPFTIKNYNLFTNIINPLSWTCIFIYVILDMKKGYFRFNINKKYCVPAIIISFINIAIYFCLGFTLGFSKSLYNHNIIAILQNFITQLLPIISIEFTRELIIARSKDNKPLIIYITILLILLEINSHTIINLLTNREEMFKYICSIIVPLIICNVLYMYFILNDACVIALNYRILGNLCMLLVPIFPNVDWYVKGSTGILLPIFMYLLFKYKFVKEKKDTRKRRENFFTKFNYVVTFVLAVILVCFMQGIFKYEPICILSNSMIPTYKQGDVVIFKKKSGYELSNIPKNSIIVYTKDDKNIAHRVISIVKANDSVLYQTKGDSNNMPDMDLVSIEQIKGVYVFHIKYIGWPSVWLYNYFNKK